MPKAWLLNLMRARNPRASFEGIARLVALLRRGRHGLQQHGERKRVEVLNSGSADGFTAGDVGTAGRFCRPGREVSTDPQLRGPLVNRALKAVSVLPSC